MKRILILLALTLPLAACKTASTSAPPPPPLTGSCNPADADMYKTLIFVQGSLLNLNATIKADETSDPNTASVLKPYAQSAVVDYNIAEAAWQGYHAACLANPSLSPASAQAAVNKVSTDMQTLPGGAK